MAEYADDHRGAFTPVRIEHQDTQAEAVKFFESRLYVEEIGISWSIGREPRLTPEKMMANKVSWIRPLQQR